jgi:hypothetical protein
VIVTVAVPVVAVAEAVSVSVEVALPFAGGVTEVGENAAVTPLGKPVVLSVVAELKLFWLVIVTVLVPFPPWATVREDGEAPIVKLGCAAVLTVSVMVVVWVVEPAVPVMVTVAVPVVAVEEAVRVKVDVALLLAGGVTGFGENAAVTPLGKPDALSVVTELKPFWLVMVMALVPLEPWFIVTDDGEAPMVKFGGGFTVNVIVAVWVVEPDVPVTVTVAVPVVAVDEAVSVRVEVALPFAGGVTGLVENAAVTPVGKPEAVSVVAALNPLRLLTVIVLVPFEPWGIVSEEGEAATVKSGVCVVEQPGNLKLAMLVFQLKLPVVAMYSSVNQKVQSSTGSTCMAL